MEVVEAMTAPTTDGQPSLPKRTGPRGLLPSTWLERTLAVEYAVCGELRSTTGRLLDVYPAGMILHAGSTRTLIAWENIAVVELVND
jgi:hypothetical protein